MFFPSCYPASPASLGLALPVGLELLAIQSCSGLVSGDCWVVGLSEVLYKEGGSWVCLGGPFRLCKGLISDAAGRV